MAWTASSLFPKSFITNALQTRDPAKFAASGGVTRQALSEAITGNRVTPAATSAGANLRRDSVVPTATTGASTTPAPTNNTSNTPPFLQGGNQSVNPQQDLLSMLQDLIGGKQQDPELTKAQTILAQQQAMEVARRNELARNEEAQQGAMSYLQSQMKDAAKYTTGSVGNILTQRYNDRLKVLQSGQPLNWLTMPSSSYSVPRRSGWTGPAMPGTWGL